MKLSGFIVNDGSLEQGAMLTIVVVPTDETPVVMANMGPLTFGSIASSTSRWFAGLSRSSNVDIFMSDEFGGSVVLVFLLNHSFY